MTELYTQAFIPYLRGFVLSTSTILNDDAIRTKVSGRYTEGGHLSDVAIKRGPTVLPTSMYVFLCTLFLN